MATSTKIPFERTQLHTDQGTIDIGALERIPLAVDVAALMLPGQVIGSCAAYIVDRATGSDHSDTLLGTAAFVGTVITVVVHSLTEGVQYRLKIIFSPVGGTELETIWDLDCVA